MSKLFLLFALIAVAVQSASVYDDVKGVWKGNAGNCEVTVQFSFKNYASYLTGSSCTNIGAYFGTFALSNDFIYIALASKPVFAPAQDDYIFYNYTLNANKDTLSLYFYPANTINVVLTKASAIPTLQGTWNGLAGGNTELLTEFDDGLYVSYTNPNSPTITPFYGILEKTGSNTTTLKYAEFINGTFGNNYRGTPIQIDPIYITPLQTGFNLFSNDSKNPFTADFATPVSATIADGVWSGFNGDCIISVEFKKGQYRSYNSGPGCSPSAFLGTLKFNQGNTKFNVTYAWAPSYTCFQGKSFEVTSTFTSNNEKLNIKGQAPCSATPFDIDLVKVQGPPKVQLINLILNYDFNNFNKTDFLNKYAQALGLNYLPQTTQIISVSGSNKRANTVELQISQIDDDTSANGELAAEILKTLQKTSNIGGSYPVTSVDGNAPTNPTTQPVTGNPTTQPATGTNAPTTKATGTNAPTTNAPTSTTDSSSSQTVVNCFVIFVVLIALLF